MSVDTSPPDHDREVARLVCAQAAEGWYDFERSPSERLALVAHARAWAARANDGVPPARTVTDFLTLLRTPSGDWLDVIGGPLVTKKGTLTQSAQDLLDEFGGADAEAEVVQSRVGKKAREIFRNHPNGDEEYRKFRQFLIEHATATVDEAIDALRPAGLVLTDLFDDIPPSCQDATVFYPCPRCGWPMRFIEDTVQCESDRCQREGANFQKTPRGLMALGAMEPPLPAEVNTDLRRLRRGAWRYTLQPGLVELDLAAALRLLPGVELTLWPALDSYDLHVEAGENLWVVDVKDWESTEYLAKHLEKRDRSKRLVIVVPEWRKRQTGILEQRCRGLNLDFMTVEKFVETVHSKTTQKARLPRRRGIPEQPPDPPPPIPAEACISTRRGVTAVKKRGNSEDRGQSETPWELLIRLAADAALALVVRYLPKPWRLDDAILFTNGRLLLWDQWVKLPVADKKRIAKYMRLRPEALADRKVFMEEAELSLNAKTRFSHVDGQPHDVFEQSPGKKIADLLDELLDDLAGTSTRACLPELPPAQDNKHLAFKYRGMDFRVPLEHVPKSAFKKTVWPKLKQAGDCDSVVFDRRRLLELADQIDQKSDSREPYYHLVLEKLLDELTQNTGGAPFGECVSLSAGPTQLLIAPTGRGKSVLSRIAALELASRGIAVAIVLPDIRLVIEEADCLEREIETLDLALTVASVNSANSLIHKAAEYMESDAKTDPPVRSPLNGLAYFCQLSVYTEPPSPHEPGREPCSWFKGRGKKRKRVVCPFAAGCPKFDSFRRAASADILVVNHSMFLTGKVKIPLMVDEDVHNMTVMEMVFRRCGVVLVDEIDVLQAKEIEGSAGQLQLSTNRRVSPLHELLNEFEHAKADGKLAKELRVERPLMHLHDAGGFATVLADLISREEVAWDHGDKMRLPRGRDAELSKRLFGDESHKIDRLRPVFGHELIVGDAHAEKLRAAIARFSQRDNEKPGVLQMRTDELSVLASWPYNLHPRRSQVPKARAQIADDLVLHVVLSYLEWRLEGLRHELPALEHYGLVEATRIRDKLVGHVPWRPSPFGPLERKAIGFSYGGHGDDDGALYAQELQGDPHGFIASLGDATALALANYQRIVLGLSATAYFPGSPESHVLSPVRLAQPDRPEGITVQGGRVHDTDQKAVRVSGEAHLPQRLERVERLSFLMWEQFLQDHLNDLAMNESTKERARVLLVTGSYPETRSAAMALSRAMGGSEEANRRIRYVAPAIEVARDKLGVRAIPRQEIKKFGELDADVLIAPLKVVARCHNIVFPGTGGKSAIASIFVLVRPVPPTDDVRRAIAHVSYKANRATPNGDPVSAQIEGERRRAEGSSRPQQCCKIVPDP